jgi:hypothetical protein
MEASLVLQRRMVAALQSWPALMAAGVKIYDGPPPDARAPYLSLGEETVLDWAWKDGGGADHRFQVSLWDAATNMARVKQTLAEVERAVLAMPRTGDGVRLVMVRALRSYVRRRPKQWSEGVVEFRALVVMEA